MSATTPGPNSQPNPRPAAGKSAPPLPGGSNNAAPVGAASKDSSLRGGSNRPGPSESMLTQAVVRKGLATPAEIEACRKHRDATVPQGKGDPKALLEVLVSAKAITPTQASRLVRELRDQNGGDAAPQSITIPGYEILGEIGKGSMGRVYRARQVSMDRVVAVKVLLDSLAASREFIKRFQREAKVAAKLNHNNIVNAIDAGESDGRHYFVMEFVEGQSVRDLLAKEKMIEEKQGIQIILAVAEALRHAHEKGLVHRDIKPDNIILTKQGIVKLADLGLARPTGDEKRAAAEAGMAIGTPYYMSPEQVRARPDIDIRADIYSLGTTFYHMMAGRVPFEGATPTDVMKKHVDKTLEATPPDHLNGMLSSGAAVVIEKMMERERENRYQSPDELIHDLKCLEQGERPLYAEQKLDALAALSMGLPAGEEVPGPMASDARLTEMASYVNSRVTVIAALAVLLAVSVVTNLILLLARR